MEESFNFEMQLVKLDLAVQFSASSSSPMHYNNHILITFKATDFVAKKIISKHRQRMVTFKYSLFIMIYEYNFQIKEKFCLNTLRKVEFAMKYG